MKRVLLSLLACGIFVSTFAQPETSEKWVITPVPNMKGVLGKLDINFPVDVERNILIYQQTNNQFLRSVSRNDKTYTIAPGEYRFTLTNVPVENVPIKKGHETRLKAGFLDIVSEGDWHLYDETKEKAYTSGNKPKKLPLPVGSYQVKLGGQFYPVIIKDGEIVEDYTPVETKNEIPGNEELKNIGTDPLMAQTNNPYWVITPLQAMTSEIGKLSIIIPKDITVHINDKWITIPYNIKATTFLETNSYTLVELPKYLTIKTYNILLNRFKVTAVPIESGKETRIKAGYLTITNKRTDPDSEAEDFFEPVTGGDVGGPIWPWELKLAENAGNVNWTLTGTKGGIYALPPGVYLLRKKNPSYGVVPFAIYYTATIKDGEWVKNGVRQ